MICLYDSDEESHIFIYKIFHVVLIFVAMI